MKGCPDAFSRKKQKRRMTEALKPWHGIAGSLSSYVQEFCIEHDQDSGAGRRPFGFFPRQAGGSYCDYAVVSFPGRGGGAASGSAETE